MKQWIGSFINWAKQKAGSKTKSHEMHSDKIHFKPEVYTTFTNELLGPLRLRN